MIQGQIILGNKNSGTSTINFPLFKRVTKCIQPTHSTCKPHKMKKTCSKTEGKWAVYVIVLGEFFIKWALQQIQRRPSSAQLHRGGPTRHDILSSVPL
jgi:hypothetical protein